MIEGQRKSTSQNISLQQTKYINWAPKHGGDISHLRYQNMSIKTDYMICSKLCNFQCIITKIPIGITHIRAAKQISHQQYEINLKMITKSIPLLEYTSPSGY